jgi:hypothetical protein
MGIGKLYISYLTLNVIRMNKKGIAKGKKPLDDLITEEIKKRMLEAFMEQLDEVTTDMLKELHKPRSGGIISREKVEKVWGTLHSNPAFAATSREVAAMAGLPLSVTQSALYILITTGRAERVVRDQSRVSRPGKPTYEYYRLDVPGIEAEEERRLFDMPKLRTVIPTKKADALSIRDIANAMEAAPATVRGKIQQLEAAGEVASVKGLTKKNQPVTKYYRKGSR